ncbi:LA_3751/LA_3752 family putative glycosyltransferase [Leptospira ryugenii]|nr:hypothetical protein [Leptospira ryugenii]
MSNLSRIQKYFPFLLYGIFAIFLFQFRANLDRNGLYVSSDGAIKLIQTVQYKEKGYLQNECLYPSKDIDPNYAWFPISYPWALLQKGETETRCVFEYPPFFYWLGAFFHTFLSLEWILFLPLCFYVLAMFVLDRLLTEIQIKTIYRIVFVFFYFFSFPLLTAMDYTESPSFLFLYLLGFFYFVRSIKFGKIWGDEYSPLVVSGVFLGLSFFLRLEILIPFAMLCLVYLLTYRDFKKTFVLGISFSMVVSLCLVYHYVVSGHILGFRYVSSIDYNQNASPSLLARASLLKAYLWGDHLMVGLLTFNPFVYLLIFGTFLMRFIFGNSRSGTVFYLSGLFSLFIIPLYITFYGGVGYFGLRYLEAPVLLLLIGFCLYFVKFLQNTSTWAKLSILLPLLALFYFNFLSTREGLKVLRNASRDLASLHSHFTDSKQYVVHTSLYSSIWMGKSYFHKRHLLTSNQEDFNHFLGIVEKGETFTVIESPKNIYISPDIPLSLHARYLTNIQFDANVIQHRKTMNMYGVNIHQFQKQ